jgi:hypothetical protein
VVGLPFAEVISEAVARRGSAERRAVAQGHDIYAVAASIIVEAAERQCGRRWPPLFSTRANFSKPCRLGIFRYRFVSNHKKCRGLGQSGVAELQLRRVIVHRANLAIPETLLATADEVIQ